MSDRAGWTRTDRDSAWQDYLSDRRAETKKWMGRAGEPVKRKRAEPCGYEARVSRQLTSAGWEEDHLRCRGS
jgi:hypothetical protein